MKITEIKIRLGQTYNMGNYSNIRPEVELTATLEDGDDFEDAIYVLQHNATEHIHRVIDDALEAEDKPPRYYDGPRYEALVHSEDKAVVIIPSDSRQDTPGAWPEAYLRFFDFRLEKIREAVAKRYGNYTVYDCSDGDYSKLPLLEEFAYYIARDDGLRQKYILVVPGHVSTSALPKSWQNYYGVYRKQAKRFRETFLAWAREFADEDGKTLIDCLDGDLSRVPELEWDTSEETLEEDDWDDELDED